MTDVKSPAGLGAFNKTLLTQAFAAGFVLSTEDFKLYDDLAGKAPDAKQYANVARWYRHIASYNADERKAFGGAASTSEEAAKEEDEDIDLFGSDDEEDDKAREIREKRLADYAAKKAKKPGPIAKSTVIFDVKPWDDTIDTTEIEKQVRGIEMDGLVWGASKILPVAFGIKKLQISCVIEDEKVSTDALEEQITGFEDLVQSVDIVAFNKI